jgi:Tol biopolymer transport system component
MGEVYRAKDPRLGREVAIKVLPEALCADAERLKRFEREARAASALNHPNIVTIHEVGSSDSVPYLVMELVSGRSLRELLAQEPLPVKKLLGLAVQIADGLARAHSAGLVHRDVKPENVMVTEDGFAKILDFGLAKLIHPENEASAQTVAPTLSALTEPGIVMGTLAYMSPEQASGLPLDFRSDQFSFGSVLYEMATGRPPFQGKTRPETLAAIIREEPEPIAALAPKTPVPLRWIIERCLAKEPRERYASTEDLARELRSLRDHVSEISASVEPLPAAPKPAGPRIVSAAFAAGLLAVLVLGFAAGRFLPSAASTHPAFQRLTFRRGAIDEARFAPDGQTIVYGAAWEGNPPELFSTRPGAAESRSLGLGRASMRAISSQGELAFLLRSEKAGVFGAGLLARAPLAGGAARELLERVQWADGSPDGNQLAIVRDVQGQSRLEYPIGKVLYQVRAPAIIRGARVSPDGRRIVFAEHPDSTAGSGAINVVDLSSNKKTLTSRPYDELFGLAWSPKGDEIWFSSDRPNEVRPSIFAVSLSGRERLVYSSPVGLRLLDVSRQGRLLVVSHQIRVGITARLAGETGERDLSWLDRSFANDLTADGRTLLFNEEGEGGGPKETVYIRRADGSPAVRLGQGWATSLTPDGKWALTIAAGGSPVVLLPTGAGEAKTLAYPGRSFLTGRFLPNGRELLLIGSEPGHGTRLYIGDRDGSAARAISPEGIGAAGLCVSPDGAFAAAVGPNQTPQLFR